jgi:pilus assembly protein Flp/PilA
MPLLQAYLWFTSMVGRAREDKGQGLTEYALILALIAVAVIAAIVFLGGTISHIFNHVGNCLNNTSASCS